MKSRLLLVFFGVALSLSAIAQRSERVELFGGYSLVSYPIGDLYSGPYPYSAFNGWEASATARIATHFGIEADFGGGSASAYSTSLKTYMGGPRYFANFGKIAVFGHARSALWE